MMLQGVHLRRHKVLKDDGTYITPRDFQVGGSVALYGKEIKIVDADAFTRSYLMDVYNIQTAEAQAYPQGHVELAALARATQAAGTHDLKLGLKALQC